MTTTATPVASSSNVTSFDPICDAGSDVRRSRETSARANTNDGIDTAEFWAAELARDSLLAKCTTIGLTSGSRNAVPAGVVNSYARLISNALTEAKSRRTMLLIRLDVRTTEVSPRPEKDLERAPDTLASPLGSWSEVTVPVPIGKKAGYWLEHLPHWLPTWKREFGFLLIDLGPIAEVPSRVIGRLCDSCFVMLGPDACGSHEWLLQQIAWHDRSGCTICGTLITEFA